jgi:exosortase/archaeosortase family protein
LAAWYRANRNDLRFLLIFVSLLGLYYLLTLTPPIKRGFFPAYLRANAVACGAILRAFGEAATVQGQAIVSPLGASIQVERGCDAVEPSALFVSAVLASPVAMSSRLAAVVAGTIALAVLNLIRVVTLYLVRVYWPAAFDTMHLDVWQALFIVIAIVLWGAWASRAAKQRTASVDVST